MMANQNSWEDKGWKQDEEYAQDKLGSDGETELSELVVIWKRLRTCNSNSMFSEDFEKGRHATMHLSTQIDWDSLVAFVCYAGTVAKSFVPWQLSAKVHCKGSHCLSCKSMDALSIRGPISLMLSRYQELVRYRETFI